MAADPSTANTVNDLLSYGLSDDDDPFAADPITETRDDKATLSPRAAKRKLDDHDKENLGLGLDEEVKITKKRKPIAKLDEARLLSQPGIPKLRALARSSQISKKLRFKGKGHEFQDVAKLLNYYQLWLDNLYPRAKFADGLQLIEKVGHSKRMNIMRKEWIDEGKPGYARDKALRKHPRDDDDDMDRLIDISGPIPSDAANLEAAKKQSHTSIFGNAADSNELFFPDTNRQNGVQDDQDPDEDELDALMAEHRTPQKPTSRPITYDSEGEDDLDALLAEQEQRSKPPPATANTASRFPSEDANEEDDLDAVLAEQESRKDLPNPQLTSSKSKPSIFDEDDNDNEDDLDALLAEQESRTQPELPQLPNWSNNQAVEKPRADIQTQSPVKNHDLDPEPESEGMNHLLSSSPLLNENDVDMLMDEQEARRSDEVAREENLDDILLSSSPVPNEESQ